MNTSKKLTAAAAALIGLGTVAFSAACSQPASAQTPTHPPIHPPMATAKVKDTHPYLLKALSSLKQTELNLNLAARTYGGHRTKAAELCSRAEQEIQLALHFNK